MFRPLTLARFMLVEVLQYLTTPAPLRHRRLGYVGQSVALHSRSRRCRRSWEPHLARTRAVIEASAAACPRRRAVAVLGSGLLDDVPLRSLARVFERVLLVDAVHPWPARACALPHRNVRLVSRDLSGAQGQPDPLAFLDEVPGLDLVVSANLLSQLPILPVDRAERRGADGAALGRRIVETHLASLALRGVRVCLVGDVRQHELARDGTSLGEHDLLFGVVLPPAPLAWSWDLAPFGEVGSDRRLVHDVVADPDWRLLS